MNQAKTKAKLSAIFLIFSASFLWFSPTRTKNEAPMHETARRYQFDEDQKRLIPLTDATDESNDKEQRKQKKVAITKTDSITYRCLLSEIQKNSQLQDWIANISRSPAAITINFQITSLQEIAKMESINENVIHLFLDNGFDDDCMLTTIELKTDVSDNTIEITIFFSNNTLDSAFAEVVNLHMTH